MNEENECSDCKWYGIFSCECPYLCKIDTKQYFELYADEYCRTIIEEATTNGY